MVVAQYDRQSTSVPGGGSSPSLTATGATGITVLFTEIREALRHPDEAHCFRGFPTIDAAGMDVNGGSAVEGLGLSGHSGRRETEDIDEVISAIEYVSRM